MPVVCEPEWGAGMPVVASARSCVCEREKQSMCSWTKWPLRWPESPPRTLLTGLIASISSPLLIFSSSVAATAKPEFGMRSVKNSFEKVVRLRGHSLGGDERKETTGV